jgi:hypothetical protein
MKSFNRVPDHIGFSDALYFLLAAYEHLLLPLTKGEGESLSYTECGALIRASNSMVVLKAMHNVRERMLVEAAQGIYVEPWQLANNLSKEVSHLAERKTRPQPRTRAHHYNNNHKAGTT